MTAPTEIEKNQRTLQLVGGADFSAAQETPNRPNPTWLALGELTDRGADWPTVAAQANTPLPPDPIAGVSSSFSNADQAAAMGLGLSKPNPFAPITPKYRFTLRIFSLERTGTAKLGQKILAAKAKPLSDGKVSQQSTFGLDFPFSFPKGFVQYLAENAQPWTTERPIHEISYADLQVLADQYTKLKGKEEKRECDTHSQPPAQSPLHKFNPGMMGMTYRGGHMLHVLRGTGMGVLPWDRHSFPEHRLMEVYPAAILRWLCLPHKKYKNKHMGYERVRKEIVDGLCKLHTVNSVTGLELKLELELSLRQVCLDNDDALDSVIACIGAAIAVCHPGLCNPPFVQKVRKTGICATIDPEEGWIYTPRQILV